MEGGPIIRPPEKQPRKGVALLLAGLGLFVLIGALDMFRSRGSVAVGWVLVACAVVLIVLAVRAGRSEQ